MALTAKALREERGSVATQLEEVWKKIEAVGAEGKEPAAEDEQRFDALYNEAKRLDGLIAKAEIVERYTSEDLPEEQQETRRLPGRDDVNHKPRETDPEDRAQQGPTEEDRALALQAWLRSAADMELEKRHQEAARKCGIRAHGKKLSFEFRRDYGKVRQEHRALSSITGTAGAYTVPEGFVNSLEMAMLEFGGMRQVAEVMRTTSGNDMPWPTTNDTSNEGAILGENTAVSDQDVTFGQVVFHAYKYSSKQIKIPVELLEDSAFDMASTVGRMLGERLGRITNRHFTVADGSSKPKGIVEAATLGKTAASSTAITADEIIDLIHSVDPAYRTGAGFMFHDNVLALLRKLKTGDGQYLWQPGIQVGVPDRLYGYPVTINQHMASSVAASAKTVIFGQLSKYKIRDVASFRLVRLNERYADSDQVGFLAFSRHDGNLLDAGVAPVKYLQQA